MALMAVPAIQAQSNHDRWQDNPELANYLSATAGARIHSCSSTDSTEWMVHNILDPEQGLKGVWRTAPKKAPPQWVVIELPEPRMLTTLLVNMAHTSEDAHQGVSARVIKVEFSVVSPDSGFRRVGREYLHRNQDLQLVSVEAAKAKWVRLTIEGNWDFPVFAELGRVYAYNDVVMNHFESVLMSEGALTVHEIHFATNSAHIAPESMPFIETVAMAMHSHPEWHLLIEGHTDATGSESHNQQLSHDRAMAVVHALIKVGIDPHRLKAVGHGAAKPMAHGESDADHAQNRRVVFQLFKP
jgi:outer membrane protein OmpA-like peptidoglycan-associated protein